MKALIVPNLEIITKEQLIIELEADGVNITDSSIPEVIWVEMVDRDQFDKWLNSEKVAGANSEDFEKRLRFQTDATTTINPDTSSTVSTSHHNWGLAQMTQSSTTLSTSFTFSQTGANVDCVIMDTGIVVGHPEFNDLSSNSSSRINQITWPGSSYNLPNFYTDTNGHGTHVAGTMAGRTQGWARDAQIYVFTTNLGSVNYGFSASQMGRITSWHSAKGTGRPTVVNMSWATSTYYPPNHPSYFITTASWDPNAIPDSQYHMARTSSYDTLVKNMNNAGIVTVCSAGNSNQRIYDPSESNWNSGYWYFFDSGNDMGYGAGEKIYKEDASAYDPNTYGTGSRTGIAGAPPSGSYGNTIYFQATNNGQSPANAWLESGSSDKHDINVQAHDTSLAKASFSNYGEPLTVWAPGTRIISSYINSGSAQQIGSTGYYFNKLQGTSMASPQVAGYVACYLDTDSSTFGSITTKANQISAQTFIKGDGDIDNTITDWGQGLTNRNRAYQPYQDYTITWATAGGSLTPLNEETSGSFDLSATFRNGASEQLHTVSHSIQSGSIPGTMSLSSSGILSGTPNSVSSGTYNFVVRSTNAFEYEDRSFALTINDASSNIKISGGAIIDAGIKLS